MLERIVRTYTTTTTTTFMEGFKFAFKYMLGSQSAMRSLAAVAAAT